MRKIEELNGVDCVDSDDLGNATEQLLYAAQIIIDLQKPQIDTAKKLTVEQELKAQFQTLQNSPLLVTGVAILATLERFRVDYAYHQNATQLLLQDIAESIDCSGAKATLADTTKITVLPTEHALCALKERWLHLNSNHTEVEYQAAIVEFEKLLGL